jgi:two-component system NtrC family sensor kinase
MELAAVQLQLDLADDLPRVQCDPAQIEQVLLALIMNALDAMPRGGNLWLSTRLLADSRGIQMVVRDDGSGIPTEVLSQIFEPFLTTKESGHGVGLGLAISHSIMERHNGKIEVQSELGKGTIFTLTLPLELGSSMRGATPITRRVGASAVGASATVPSEEGSASRRGIGEIEVMR